MVWMGGWIGGWVGWLSKQINKQTKGGKLELDSVNTENTK